MDLHLAGHRALVTASTGGIGAAIARSLAAEGVRVLVQGRSAEAAGRLAAEIGGEALPGDLTSPGAAEDVGRRAAERGVDVLVHNLGPFAEHTWDDATAADWRASYDGNVVSLVRLLQPLLPSLSARGWGRVVTIGSRAATTPLPTMVEYSAAKAAVVNLTSSLAQHLAGTGVTANVVSPGVIATPGLREMFADDPSREASYAPNPAGRLGTPEDVAAAVTFVCSPVADYVNGTELRVDGGISPLA
ncbi:3-oxoacyl-ACP reductase [Marmoricola endophyticus]|uniref:3-oxoacyl-ACP reductase n=1 Tax=Marmoricola endophyticus TaxID=2040280 RepID=A0A917F271_9ACTN|nr:SDR family NAD(P)-dependent oxidoreductase [Marmoricola endophyticus]GGF45561.1 3-oxoacyl-ACP reductase [Marmoricola endophyticus]